MTISEQIQEGWELEVTITDGKRIRRPVGKGWELIGWRPILLQGDAIAQIVLWGRPEWKEPTR